MNLEQQVMEAIKTAMKEKNQVALRTYRAIKAAILVEKTAEGATGDITPEQELKLLQKMAKQRNDSAAIFRQQQRHDLVQIEEEELEILNTLLPKQMTNDEIKHAVQAIIQEVGATSAKDMGIVMGAANKSMTGKADGKVIAEIVKEQLLSIG